MESEPLLQNIHNKFTIFPIQFPDIWECYLNHEKAKWVVGEIDLTVDLKDWKKLSENEKYFIKHVLAFFAASDGIVMENLATRFCSEVQIAEARSFYVMQMYIENIHSIVYSQLIETYIPNVKEKNDLFNAIEKIPAVGLKAKWAQKWINSEKRFAIRLIAFAIVEGIFFSGSFCCIFWLKEKGVMPGLCMSNDMISRDEGLHYDFAILLHYKYIVNKVTLEELKEILMEAVEIEKQFIIKSLPCSLLGMNACLMSNYIEFVADRLVKQLGYESIFNNIKNPFPFMDRVSLQNHTNFFEHRVSEYQQSFNPSIDVVNDKNLSFNDDF
jgi:ribonucleoside-diphosphate reductase beta chain